MKKRFLLLIIIFGFGTNNYAQVCSNNICETGETIDVCPRDCWLDTIEVFSLQGGRVDWDKSGSNKIAFDMKDSIGFYDVYTINPNQTSLSCITCNATGVPQNHNGNPAWSPNGEWIVFLSEHEHIDTTVSSNDAEPGKGTRNNLYVYNTISQQFTQLTFLPDSQNMGVLHPHFSHDGSMLSWSQMYDSTHTTPFGQLFGVWNLKTANFVIDSAGNPSLQNINTYQPFAEVFYENHGFSPNDSSLLFSSNRYLWIMPPGNNTMFTIDLYSQNTITLTDTAYNEHAQYTVDGNKILWGSTKNNPNKGMDYWIMNTDGTNKQRVTYFNDSTQYEYLPEAYAVDMSFSADGSQMLGYVQTNLVTQNGLIYMFTFNNNPSGIHDELQNKQDISIYPNPTSGNIQIELDKTYENITVNIRNVMGQLIKTEKFNSIKCIPIKISGNKGVYFVEVISDDSKTTIKVIKQ